MKAERFATGLKLALEMRHAIQADPDEWYEEHCLEPASMELLIDLIFELWDRTREVAGNE